MSSTLELFCWVQGDDLQEAFSLEIAGTKTVSALKKAIKEEKKVAFEHVDAGSLKLWAVSVKYNPNEGAGGPLQCLELKDGIDGVRKLTPLERLKAAFPKRQDDHIHVVVERPPTATPPSSNTQPHSADCTLELFCWVQGDPHDQAFSLQIAETKTVSALKKAIKEEKKIAFGHVDADSLKLWKVAVDMTRNFDDSLNRLKLEDGVEGVQELKAPWEDISQVFSDPPRKHLHIVVERPSTDRLFIMSGTLNLNEEFLAACLSIPNQGGNQSPVSPTDTLVSQTAFSFGKSEKIATEYVVSMKTRLTDNYPNTYSDFYPSRAPCVFKSGPDWQVRSGPQAQGIVREARPVNGHDIGRTWLSIGTRIYEYLDSTSVKWTSINPLAYANAGEAKPFCPLIVSIGVKPYSLLYEAAVAAATGVKKILAEVGFPGIEVAFVESVVTRSVAASPKLLSFNPLLDHVPNLRKPFTTALGLSIAPLKYPHFEGTAALFFRMSRDNKRTAILTCAHVARPPPVYGNTGMTRTNPNQPREEFVALGNGGYNNAVKAMMTTIGNKLRIIEVWKNALDRLGEFVQGENNQVTERRKEYEALVAKAMKDIEAVNALHDEVTKRRTIPDQRVVGFLLHSGKIEVAVEPHGFTNDWALVELYEEKIDWSTFMGNKVYVGGNLSIADFANTMFPQPSDRANYQYPEDGLLQAYGIVQDDEIRNPQHLDVHGERCVLVVKNGLTTGTTVGRTNGLDSFTRIYTEYGIKQTSIELAVLPYDKVHGKFSDAGDSGSIVLARDGRIVGILTGGAGPTDETDITYVTPYWWVEKQIKAKYPSCFLYDIVQ